MMMIRMVLGMERIRKRSRRNKIVYFCQCMILFQTEPGPLFILPTANTIDGVDSVKKKIYLSMTKFY